MIQGYVPPQMWKAWEVASSYTKDHNRTEMVQSIQGVMSNAWTSISSQVCSISTVISTTIQQQQQQMGSYAAAATGTNTKTSSQPIPVPKDFSVNVQTM